MNGARPILLVALLGLGVFVQGCAHYRVVVPEPTPATDFETDTMQAFLWGAIEDTKVTDNCVDNAIDEVRVRQTLPHVLATVLTLGIWMPLEVEWRCAKRQQSEGSGF